MRRPPILVALLVCLLALMPTGTVVLRAAMGVPAVIANGGLNGITNASTWDSSGPPNPTDGVCTFLSVMAFDASGNDPDGTVPATVTALAGLTATFVRVASVQPTTQRRLYVFRASTTGSGNYRITFDSDQTALIARWIEISGTLTGTNCDAAVVQSVTNTVVGTAAITCTLAAFTHADNGTIAFVGSNANPTYTPGTGFTELFDVTSAENQSHSMEYRVDNDTTADVTATGLPDQGCIAIEVGVTAAGVSVPKMMLMGVGAW